MSVRWIVLVLVSFSWLGCGEATVRPFSQTADAGVGPGDGEDGGVEDGGDDDDGDDDGGIDDDDDEEPADFDVTWGGVP